MGASGSGKTTLMNFLRGEGSSSKLNLEEGDVFLNNEKIDNLRIIKRSVGYV